MKHKRKSKRKDKTCHVKGCDNDKKHWKQYKKETKEEREMKQLDWD